MIFLKIVSPKLYLYTAGTVISRFPINSIHNKIPEMLEYRLIKNHFLPSRPQTLDIFDSGSLLRFRTLKMKGGFYNISMESVKFKS